MSLDQVYATGPTEDDNDEFSAGQTQTQTNNLDALLDEIDTVLETNATQFVQGFVQKGGQ